MRSAIDIPAFGAFADIPLLTRAAREAESVGWDAFLLWDHISWAVHSPVRTADAWLAAAVIAAATERIQIGMAVSPLPRRLPQEVARQATTLHDLSGGRFILGVGSGGGGAFDEAEFGAFGMATDPKTRGAQLDEALEVIIALWSGGPVSHRGRHFTADGISFSPASPYAPGSASVPIWVGGRWGRRVPLRRAARYDAYLPIREDPTPWLPDDVATARRQLAEAQPPGTEHPVAVVLGGRTGPADAVRLAELDGSGLDWWSEGMPPWDRSTDEVFDRIARGPRFGG